ncbi:MAG: hypothetical protein H9901_05025 [Candidatus Paralactobacillus gallistercoris]|uniref:Uncharacterized protein n=1 Tax=Candidatus Paralactobacillus gallistercoris TaxID=2838724 RepID=A0A948TJZ1_9LACO|nr:hypothetical protein [Candidatus Paralactobacillus gallistercoris]
MVILCDLIVILLTLALLIVINNKVSSRVSIWIGPLVILFLTFMSWQLSGGTIIFPIIYFICMVAGFIFTWLGRPLNK